MHSPAKALEETNKDTHLAIDLPANLFQAQRRIQLLTELRMQTLPAPPTGDWCAYLGVVPKVPGPKQYA